MASVRLFGLVCAVSLVCSCLAPLVAGEDEESDYAMFHSVDETKVSIISGNFTVAVTTGDWPRMVFWHTVDPFSPTFDMGFPEIQLFNDTDGDGRFCRSETGYTVFLDSNHVEWNVSPVASGFMPDLGEYVEFSMSADVDAYNETLDAPPAVESWANITFWFRLAEEAVSYVNPAGAHSVAGKTEMFVNMTVEVTNRTGFQFLAVERFLQGGATTDMFHLLENGSDGDVNAVLSARVDESLGDGEFTRPLNGTESSTQCIDLAKDDGTVQAFYRWGSEARDLSGNASPGIHVNSSCYTTGTGLVLHSVLPLSNGTLAFSLDSSLGIVESGFVGAMTDWLKEHSSSVAVVAGAAAAVMLVVLHIALRRRRLGREGSGPESGDAP